MAAFVTAFSVDQLLRAPSMRMEGRMLTTILVIVLALLVLIIGPLMILRTPTDIFPSINIPVVSVIWRYNGLSTDEIEGRIGGPFERAVTATVNDECRKTPRFSSTGRA